MKKDFIKNYNQDLLKLLNNIDTKDLKKQLN